jgi:hypothetical protein
MKAAGPIVLSLNCQTTYNIHPFKVSLYRRFGNATYPAANTRILCLQSMEESLF